MKCPYCAHLGDKVVDSRESKEGEVIRRRRECLECGNVVCCDSSVGQHATEHFHDTTHPVMETAEPGEDWRWCYAHHLTA